MSLTDILPDRPLTFDEFQSLQRNDSLGSVTTLDKPGQFDVLFVTVDGTEHEFRYTDEQGWHTA